MMKQLNTSCSFQNGVLVWEITGDIVEVVLKVKMKWRKHTVIKDRYNRTEKFHPWERANRRVRIIPEGRECPDIHRTQTQMTLEVTVESTDSGTCIMTDKGFNYPPLIFTDPEHAGKVPDSDIDSVTEGPKISSYVGNYCENCVTKWSRCVCKLESDWDDDQNYIVETQADS